MDIFENVHLKCTPWALARFRYLNTSLGCRGVCTVRAGKSLSELVVRRNAVRQRSDWFKAQSWSDDFYRRLRTAARSYDETEREISRLLDTRWTMLPDRLFRQVHV